MRGVFAPIDGQVMSVNAQVGDKVKRDETVLAVMFALKMEIPVYPEEDGIIKVVKVKEGEIVQQGDTIFELD